MAGQHGLGRGLSSLIPQKKDMAQRQASQPLEYSKNASGTAPVVTGDVRDTKKPQREKKVIHGNHPPHVGEVATAKQKKQLAVIGVPIGDVIANEQQPRIYFNEEKLGELSQSIKEHGVLQPLTVIKKDERYELIAGERRLRAAKKAGLTKVPVIVRGAMTDLKKLELAIIENVQRDDLNIIEEAKSYKKLADEFSLSQEEIAQKTGKSRSVIANRMRLAKLPIDVQRGLIEGKISEGHAKVILSLENSEKQRALYDMITREKLSVRDTEKKLHNIDTTSGTRVQSHARAEKTPQEKMLEDQLASYFGTKVGVKNKGKGGTIAISYFSDDELKDILSKLKI